MKIEQMIAKSSVAGGRIASKGLGKITSGSSENDFVQDGLVARIVEASNKGYYDKNMSENAVFVIMEVCTVKDGKVTPTGEAVQVYLSMFDRIAAPILSTLRVMLYATQLRTLYVQRVPQLLIGKPLLMLRHLW